MWIKLSGALLAALSMINLADAGLLGSMRGLGAGKSCGCASTCQPACCKPVIVKPCCPNVYTYQRKCSDIKPPCCDTCCPPAAACAPACAAPAACAPAAMAPACAAPAACAPAAAPACAAPAACAPAAAPACAAPAACAPAAMAPACAAPAACAPAACAPGCAAPAGPGCAAPCAPACTTACAPACSPKKGLLSGLFSSKKVNCGSCNTCAAPAATCAAPCEVRCCNADPCEIAKLIYQSQTACYAKDRRAAIHKLGDKYDCICNPEIMTAFIVGLNDCDERVRRKAADEIGDQIKKHCCCCPEVVAALTCALGDCDKWVVKQAKEALERCGYEVVDGCCNPCGTTCTTGNGCAPAAAPAPVPPCNTGARSTGLQQLLGLLD